MPARKPPSRRRPAARTPKAAPPTPAVNGTPAAPLLPWQVKMEAAIDRLRADAPAATEEAVANLRMWMRPSFEFEGEFVVIKYHFKGRGRKQVLADQEVLFHSKDPNEAGDFVARHYPGPNPDIIIGFMG